MSIPTRSVKNQPELTEKVLDKLDECSEEEDLDWERMILPPDPYFQICFGEGPHGDNGKAYFLVINKLGELHSTIGQTIVAPGRFINFVGVVPGNGQLPGLWCPLSMCSLAGFLLRGRLYASGERHVPNQRNRGVYFHGVNSWLIIKRHSDDAFEGEEWFGALLTSYGMLGGVLIDDGVFGRTLAEVKSSMDPRPIFYKWKFKLLYNGGYNPIPFQQELHNMNEGRWLSRAGRSQGGCYDSGESSKCLRPACAKKRKPE